MEKLYKCYENSLVADRVKKCVKLIEDIDVVPIKDGDTLHAILWYAKFDYAGTIMDEHVKGIRIRLGNILIGNRNTANQYFREERFNGWLIGELFICDDSLIPNARRDDFENTEENLKLISSMTEWSSSITKEIRRLSLDRSTSAEKKKAIEAYEENNVSDEDINGLLTEVIGFADEDAEISGKIDESSYVANNELLGRFQMLLGQKNNNFKYRILNLRSDIPVDQRKMLEKVIDIIHKIYPKKKAETISEDIVKNY